MFNATDFAQRLANRQDRWSLFKDFVAEWYAPLRDGDGYSAEELDAAERRLGVALPVALREWYMLAGRREDITARQNFLVSTEDLAVEKDSGLLEFLSENQQVVMWGLRPADLVLADPPVWLDASGLYTTRRRELIRENDTLSEFALQMALLHTTLRPQEFIGPWHIEPGALGVAEQVFVRLGFPDWHWPRSPTRFYGGRDALFWVAGEDEFWWAARTQAERDRIVVALRNVTTDG